MVESTKRSAGTPRLSSAGTISEEHGIPRLTTANEDYLEAIYALGGHNGTVRSIDLATHMGVSKASVNKAVSTLKQAGLVNQPHYGDMSLTDSGAEYASSVLHRHLVLLSFLTDILGVDPDVAKDEACMMEHAISSDTLERIAALINRLRS